MVGVRNRHSHNESFSTDDTYRALDTIERLLGAFGDRERQKRVKQQRDQLNRQRFEAEARSEYRKIAARPTESRPQAGLTPWREVIQPHPDVAGGRFAQSEFAADLYDVWSGDAAWEYQDPEAFFRRTFLTEGLRQLLTGAARRLAGAGGAPVIELQTNFGGGKTHSLIALYHLASGVPPASLAEVGEMLGAEGIDLPRQINRAVFVGQSMSPTDPKPKPDGQVVNTIWGEIAYQLVGEEGYSLVAGDDAAATNPGAKLRDLFRAYGPAVVLIDEWVAYARQLPRDPGRERGAGGDFDTQFTFAQALTEAASAVDKVVVLIAIPSSVIEVGGDRGREALELLKNVVNRTATQWQPASPDESLEIVRRRLFDPISPAKARVRDGVIRAYLNFYRKHQRYFPMGVDEGRYQQRMELSYPIHPELFDRLFEDWSALDKFQRTRGALRLMAEVISELWTRQDRSLLIMPGTLPMDSPALVAELKKYLEDGWDPVIKRDVDGPNSLPLRLDQQNRTFGRFSAARRVARTIYMGSAPRPDNNRGVDIRQVLLGCTQPGEPPTQFSDALRYLSSEATHLYIDGQSYWYQLQANVTRMAQERATHYDVVEVDAEIRRRLSAERRRGPFIGVHVFPDGPGRRARRGVRGAAGHSVTRDGSHRQRPEQPGGAGCERPPVPTFGRTALASQHADVPGRLHQEVGGAEGSGPFLSGLEVHHRRGGDTEPDAPSAEAGHHHEGGHRSDHQLQDRRDLRVRPITWPEAGSTPEIEWHVTKPSGKGGLAERVANRLVSEEKLIYGGIRVRMDLDNDRARLWSEEGDIEVNHLWSIYTRYPYMPRLAGFQVLAGAISDGTANLAWESETFAYAEAREGDTWKGLKSGQQVVPARSGYLVHPDVVPPPPADPDPSTPHPAQAAASPTPSRQSPVSTQRRPSPGHFYACFDLDRVRGVRQLDDILANVTAHLGKGVRITLEIQAESPEGFDDRIRRVVQENARQLGSRTAEFE